MKKLLLFCKNQRRKIAWFLLLLFAVFVCWYIQCLPEKLFSDSTSTVLLDRNGELLGARIAADGQWRFEPGDSVPVKFEKCLLQFEDRKFYRHAGISSSGIMRSVVQNIKHRRIKSGGSTITMQLMRIMRKNPDRTFSEKILEMVMATRAEIRYSKKEILQMYADNAPFGNNVVGLEAASWRYYGRSACKLSWAETATLAVLPNAPGLIYPGKNQQRLLEKRNRLLKRLFDIHELDETTYNLALSEPLPGSPLPLPRLAPHLIDRTIKEGHAGKTLISTIDRNLQEKTRLAVKQHTDLTAENKIYNAAVLITSVKTGEVLAYVGNSESEEAEHSAYVDCSLAPRSTGSILKPFLYARAMEAGLINPHTLLLDVPSHFGSFSPKNFSHQYDGAIPASQALSRSLNIPFVRLLNEYGLEKFRDDLKGMGVTSIKKRASHYGLSLILGGAEATLWDLNLVYASMAQSLEYREVKGVDFLSESAGNKNVQPLDRACIYSTFEAMAELNRPDEDGNWKTFSSSRKIAWKTGTSFGFRDAWAIGVTPDYVVSVWVGNADGEGRPGLTGIKAAAPLMLHLFGLLPKSKNWFVPPFSEMVRMKVCSESGYRAGELCEHAVYRDFPKACLETTVCPYHQLVHLDKKSGKRVDADCENPFDIKHVSWFILPPGVEKYYKFNHPTYKTLPEYKPECLARVADKAMVILYPKPNSKIYVPIEIDGRTGQTVFEAAHRNGSVRIYWHLDDDYLGETKEIHQWAFNPSPGKHTLLLTDETGQSQQLNFEVIGR